MARPRYPRSAGPLPPPLPPERRTVGQLIAETIRIYGSRFWAGLALGVPPALVDAVTPELSRSAQLVFVPVVGALVLTISYVAASVIVLGRPSDRGRLVTAIDQTLDVLINRTGLVGR